MSDELVRGDSPWRGARPPVYMPVRFIPRWRLRRFLKPMNDRCLIAPLTQAMHSSLVYARKHERPHGILVLPNSSRPESIPSIAKNRDTETAYF
jgi:hypothetical protein